MEVVALKNIERVIKKSYLFIFTPIYIAVLIYFNFWGESNVATIVPTTGIYLSILYFYQKQNLEELKTFKNLFTEFNERYDQLNGNLYDISCSRLTDENKVHKVLDDYFNICSEEYLFYRQGLILDDVWGSWCRGINEYLKNDVIKDYWTKSQKENSYYGLTTDVIEKDSKL